MTELFAPRDVVRLNGQNVRMTVVSVGKDWDESPLVKVVWHDAQQILHEKSFPPELLVKVEITP